MAPPPPPPMCRSCCRAVHCCTINIFLLMALFGILCLIGGIWGKTSSIGGKRSLLDEGKFVDFLHQNATILIIYGCLLCFTALMGCFAYGSGNRCFLVIFIVFSIGYIIFHIVAISTLGNRQNILSYEKNKDFPTVITLENWLGGIRSELLDEIKYNYSTLTRDKVLKYNGTQLTGLEVKYRCCAADGAGDYGELLRTKSCTSAILYYDKKRTDAPGCIDALRDKGVGKRDSIVVVLEAFIVMYFLGIIVALLFCIRPKNNDSDDEDNDLEKEGTVGAGGRRRSQTKDADAKEKLVKNKSEEVELKENGGYNNKKPVKPDQTPSKRI